MERGLRHTALHAAHLEAGARMAPFAGWSMPLQFEGTLLEHEAVRTAVGAFDVSHLGTVFVDGPDALATIAASFTNDPSVLTDGASQYTLAVDDRGGVLDDLIVYRLGAERFLVIPNAANTGTVVAVLREVAVGRQAAVRDESTEWAVIAVQGPRALDTVDAVLAGHGDGAAVRSLADRAVREIMLDAGPGVVCRTGYTGEEGCEMVVSNAAAPSLWRSLLDQGARPCGLGARDTLRLEMGYPLHGNELTPEVDPFEAGLAWAVALDRAAFRGRDALLAAKERGPARRRQGLLAASRRPARAGMTVLRDDATVGHTTSGGFSPSLGRGIALALLDAGVAVGDEVEVDVRGSAEPFTVVRPPFVTPGTSAVPPSA
jgi:aminomethyltransferase